MSEQAYVFEIQRGFEKLNKLFPDGVKLSDLPNSAAIRTADNALNETWLEHRAQNKWDLEAFRLGLGTWGKCVIQGIRGLELKKENNVSPF